MNKKIAVALLSGALLAGIGVNINHHQIAWNNQVVAHASASTDDLASAQTVYQKWQTAFIHHPSDQPNQSFVDSDDTDTSAAGGLTTSEAQGYGMTITALAAQHGWASQQDYDQLYNFYVAHQQTAGTKLMAWEIKADSTGKMTSADQSNATDGDMFIAYSLIMASKQWGNNGAINYGAEADALLKDIATYNVNPQTKMLNTGDWSRNADNVNKMFRSSDLVPSYFKTFYQSSHQAVWNSVYKNSLSAISQMSKANSTGLIPDFAQYGTDGKVTNVANNILGGTDADQYSWNACRVPMEWSWSGDGAAKNAVTKILKFIDQQNPLYAGYQLDGTPTVNYSSSAFEDPADAARLAESNILPQSEVTKAKAELYSSANQGSYYGDSLRTLGVMNIWNKNK